MEDLTKIQKEIYAYIAGYITDYGYSPTYQEIASKLNLTTQSVGCHVKNIASRGWFKFNGNRNRNLELIPKDE